MHIIRPNISSEVHDGKIITQVESYYNHYPIRSKIAYQPTMVTVTISACICRIEIAYYIVAMQM
jgi:hypothetical protein